MHQRPRCDGGIGCEISVAHIALVFKQPYIYRFYIDMNENHRVYIVHVSWVMGYNHTENHIIL
jgi:hypothetical protein